jgi:hypothetical protein
MRQIRDWQGMKEKCARLLKERTGEDVKTWNDRFTRLVWTTDVMPHEVAGPIKALVEQGAIIMKRTLESETEMADPN